MRAGQLRELITIERSTTEVDQYGTPVVTWRPLIEMRVAVVRQSTEEFMRNVGQIDEKVVVFHARYAPDVQPEDRILWRGRYHDIREVAPDERNREMEIRTVTT
jgi:SPP1 family predicted phage head-tail adaptor